METKPEIITPEDIVEFVEDEIVYDDFNGRRLHGLAVIVHVIEHGGMVTLDKLRGFMDDIQVPSMTEEELVNEVMEAGGSSLGFTRLHNFFVFICNQLRDTNDKRTLAAFQKFDEEDTGFISLMTICDVVSNLGEPLRSDELDKIIKMSDLDGEGDINYDEVLKIWSLDKKNFLNFLNFWSFDKSDMKRLGGPVHQN